MSPEQGSLATRAYDRAPGLVVFACIFTVYALTASWGRATSIDVEAAILPAYQLAATGTPWLEGLNLDDVNPWLIEVGGHLVSNRQVGISMLAVPFYLASGVPFAVWPSALAAVTAAALAVALMHCAVRTLATARVAWGATLVMAVGSPTWAVSADALWGHTVTQLSISAGAYFASRNRWWLAGVGFGLGILARPHVALIALVVGLGVGVSRRSPRIVLAVGIPSAVATLLLLAMNRWVFGIWTLTGYAGYGASPLDNVSVLGSGALTTYLSNWAGLLIAPDRGLFVWTPIALLLLPAAWRARRGAPDWVPILLLGGIAYTALQMRVNAFHGGDTFFGYRHGLELFTCAIPLYSLAWQDVRGWLRRVVAALVVLQVFAMFIGAIQPLGYLTQEDVWTQNTMVYLLLEQPSVAGPLYVVVLILAVLVARRTLLWPPAEVEVGGASKAAASQRPAAEPRS